MSDTLACGQNKFIIIIIFLYKYSQQYLTELLKYQQALQQQKAQVQAQQLNGSQAQPA